jgi:hypothetical protein
MFTNRISAYFNDVEEGGRPQEQTPAPEAAQPPFTPRGFIPVPSPLLGAMINAQELYRAAYEQAQKDARQRLLDLLRSRLTG